MHADTKQPHMTHLTQKDWSRDLDSDMAWEAPKLSSIRNILAYSRSTERQPTAVGSPVTHLN